MLLHRSRIRVTEGLRMTSRHVRYCSNKFRGVISLARSLPSEADPSRTPTKKRVHGSVYNPLQRLHDMNAVLAHRNDSSNTVIDVLPVEEMQRRGK